MGYLGKHIKVVIHTTSTLKRSTKCFAFNPFVSGWVSGVTNNACFPVLFLSYVHNQFFPDITETDRNVFLHYGILAGITLLLAFVNYWGLEVVGKASSLIFFVSMAPFVLMIIIGIPKGKFIGHNFISAHSCLFWLRCAI